MIILLFFFFHLGTTFPNIFSLRLISYHIPYGGVIHALTSVGVQLNHHGLATDIKAWMGSYIPQYLFASKMRTDDNLHEWILLEHYK